MKHINTVASAMPANACPLVIPLALRIVSFAPRSRLGSFDHRDYLIHECFLNVTAVICRLESTRPSDPGEAFHRSRISDEHEAAQLIHCGSGVSQMNARAPNR